jgi:NitT/TauT family transport system substrate-binding protein
MGLIMNKQAVLAIIFIISSAFLASCSTNQQPLKVASHVWPGYEFMFLGRELDLLDSSLVSLVETKSASESLQLLESSSVDAAALTLDEVMRAISEGVDLVVVLVFNISAGADVLLGNSQIQDISQLKNKKIGVETGAVGAIMLSQVLEKCGCDNSEVKIIDISSDKHLKAWEDGQVDAVITYEPVYSQLMEKGANKLFSSKEIPKAGLNN